MRVMTSVYRQQGAALLVSLIILLVLSIIGISAMRGGLLQTLIAANSQQAEMAFSASDSGNNAMFLATAQQQNAAGGIASTAMAAATAETSYTVDDLGVVAAAAGDPPFFDADRDTPITTVASVTAWVPECPECPGFSAKVGSGTGNNGGCNAIRTNSTGTVGDTSSEVEQVLSVLGTSCQANNL